MSKKFILRGSHDKWYPKWARPGVGDANIQAKVDAGFLRLVEEELCKYQVSSGMARPRACSESTTSSEMTLDHLPEPKNFEKEGVAEFGARFRRFRFRFRSRP